MENLKLHVVTPVPRTDTSTGVIEAIDLTGDSKVYWDKNRPIEVEQARATFDKLKSKGYAAHSLRGDGTKGDVIREFDPDAERIVMVPQMAGG